jgi:hypothetical protein
MRDIENNQAIIVVYGFYSCPERVTTPLLRMPTNHLPVAEMPRRRRLPAQTRPTVFSRLPDARRSLRRLRTDPALMPLCVEECLRYVSSVQMTASPPAGWLAGTAIPTQRHVRRIVRGDKLRCAGFEHRHASNSSGQKSRSHASASSHAFRTCASLLNRRSSGTSALYKRLGLRALAQLPAPIPQSGKHKSR